jgi:hypothetical protein
MRISAPSVRRIPSFVTAGVLCVVAIAVVTACSDNTGPDPLPSAADLVIQADVKPVTVSFGMGIGLLFYDASLGIANAINQGRYVQIGHTGSDLPLFYITDGNGNGYRSSAPTLGTWYTVRISYTSSTGRADLLITNTTTGQVFYQQNSVAFNPVSFNAVAYGAATSAGDGTTAEMHYDNVTVSRTGQAVYAQAFGSSPSFTFASTPQTGDSYSWDAALGLYKIRLTETTALVNKFALSAPFGTATSVRYNLTGWSAERSGTTQDLSGMWGIYGGPVDTVGLARTIRRGT